MTNEQVKAWIILIHELGCVIREAGQIPAGHLYAPLTGKLSLAHFQTAIKCLKNAGVVKEKNHLLFWIGPGSEN
jgi:hypothetical protein